MIVAEWVQVMIEDGEARSDKCWSLIGRMTTITTTMKTCYNNSTYTGVLKYE